MTKKEFIWLVIRFLGIAWFVLSFGKTLSAIATLPVMLSCLPPSFASEKLILISLFGSFIESGIHILIVAYLIFFGKFLFNIVHRTLSQSLDIVLEKQEQPVDFQYIVS